MTDDDNSSNFASFMSSAKDGENKNVAESKTKTALQEKRDKDKEDKDKELNDAKKEASANAYRPNANMATAQGKQILAMLPFIVSAIIVLIFLFTRGGKIISFIFDKTISFMMKGV
ncbi:MAG: hypothetical protein Ta2D_09430 [Rickettsiales bacterium]|nr:MAG: hypothetical protein Ta2D_09430 [Rickettsiales bacterium]